MKSFSKCFFYQTFQKALFWIHCCSTFLLMTCSYFYKTLICTILQMITPSQRFQMKEYTRKKFEIATKQFHITNMIVNPCKFEAIIINTLEKMTDSQNTNIGDKLIASTKSVTLLGLQIDNRLTFLIAFNTLQESSRKIKCALKVQRFNKFFH